MEIHQNDINQKRKKARVDENSGSDRISSLHDSILHLILSFLPARDVVQTSLLSKRWQKLWISLPYLNFIHFGSIYKKRFVNNFLHYRNKSGIIRFRLGCEGHSEYTTEANMIRFQLGIEDDLSYDSAWSRYRRRTVADVELRAWNGSHIDAWISAAVNAGVQELDLYPKFKELRRLPSCLFTCNTLVTLKLINIEYEVQFPDLFCFPMLKSMQLCRINFANNFSRQLLKSPNLDSLFLRECTVGKSSRSSSHNDNGNDVGIFSNLEEAHVGLGLYGSYYMERVSIFIRKLSNVKILHLSDAYIKLLKSEINLMEHLPRFCNLKHLELGLSAKNGDLAVMGCLLNCSPLLQSLEIIFDFADRSWNENGRMITENQFDSLRLPTSLKWVRMKDFCGEENQLDLLILLLRDGVELEKIIVEVNNYWKLSAASLMKLRPSTSSCLVEIRKSDLERSLSDMMPELAYRL